MKFKILFLVVAVLMLSACGGNSDDTNQSELDLNGTWISNCHPDDGDYLITEFMFSGSSLSGNTKYFRESDCGNPYATVSATGNFTFGNTIITSSGVEAEEIDFILYVTDEVQEILSLVRIDSQVLNFGDSSSGSIRPVDIDFDVTFYKQEI